MNNTKKVCDMKLNEKVIHYFFYKEEDFFKCVQRLQSEKITSLKLKKKIFKICFLNFSGDFCKSFYAKTGEFAIADNLRLTDKEKYEMRFDKTFSKKGLNLFILNKAKEAIESYNSIPSKLRKGLMDGQTRTFLVNQLGLRYDKSYRIVPKIQAEREQVEKDEYLTTTELNQIAFFEKTWFDGRVITNQMWKLLEKAGKTDEYRNK